MRYRRVVYDYSKRERERDREEEGEDADKSKSPVAASAENIRGEKSVPRVSFDAYGRNLL